MANQDSKYSGDPRFTKTFRDDLRQIKVKDELSSEYKDLKEYFLTEDRKKKLEGMSKFKKFFLISCWLLKSLYFRLTPFRRFLLLIGIILILLSGNTRIDSEDVSIELVGTAMIVGFIFLFILALELKDKLLAKTELEEGHAVQQALMPERNPKVPGWDFWLFTTPANDVGGDLLDFIQLTEIKFGVAVVDVAGKCLSAALLMAKLQATIRALIPDYTSLSHLGDKLNKIFYRDSIPKIFASLIYLELNSDFGAINMLIAGHIPPLLVKENTIKQLDKDAPALGLIPDVNFKEQNLLLNENDFLIIYSDGVTEAQNEAGEFFGEDKLKEKLNNILNLSSEVVGEKLLASINSFVGKANFYDDLTLAILKKV